MKREFPPLYTALLLVLGCVVLRLIDNAYPEMLPGVSPMMALAYVGAMYLPRKWGWLAATVALLLTQAAFLEINYKSDGSGVLFSAWTVIGFLFGAAIFAAASAFGVWIARRKSLAKILGGSVVCSLVFYVATNTYSWFYDNIVHLPGGYAMTWAGWVQANTTGIPGYDPAWHFLRNGMAGDLFFAIVLLLVLDRAFLFQSISAKAAPRMA
jgi:hypothetical protein